jgi:hypothetical protein
MTPRAAVVPRWMILGEWRAHPVRIVTAVLAIAIGVALGFAVHLVNASALDRFARGLATVNGGADLRIQARGVQGFDEGLYPRVAHMQSILGASPVVALHVRLDGQALDLLGLDVLRAGAVTPALLPRPTPVMKAMCSTRTGFSCPNRAHGMSATASLWSWMAGHCISRWRARSPAPRRVLWP